MEIVHQKRTTDILNFLIWGTVIVLINICANRYFFRLDLTEENRYTINDNTKEMLKKLNENVYVEILLTGELNPDFKRLQKSIDEILTEFNIYSDNKVQYSRTDPLLSKDENTRNQYIQHLASIGINPTRLYDNEDGKRTQKLIFPGAIVSYGTREEGVTLLNTNKTATAVEKINQSIEGLEYQLASTIAKLTEIERTKIGIVEGQGELSYPHNIGMTKALEELYFVEKTTLQNPLEHYSALIIAKPTKAFSEQDKYHLDQYVMKGGNLLLLMDKLDVNIDSISSPYNYAFPYELNLDDLLFKYGVRINNTLVQDRIAGTQAVVVGNVGGQPQIRPIRWPFYPLINHFSDHPAVRNLDAVLTQYVSTIDTVKAIGIKKTPLLFSSQYSRSLTAPVQVSLARVSQELTPEKLNQKHLPIGYLLEGRFTSLFKNRFAPSGVAVTDKLDQSKGSKIVIIADGNIAENQVNTSTNKPAPLGYDLNTRNTYANKDLILNLVEYITNSEGLITSRAKEVRIRPLDNVKIEQSATFWKVLNLILPIALLLLFGISKHYLRKKKYANY